MLKTKTYNAACGKTEKSSAVMLRERTANRTWAVESRKGKVSGMEIKTEIPDMGEKTADSGSSAKESGMTPTNGKEKKNGKPDKKNKKSNKEDKEAGLTAEEKRVRREQRKRAAKKKRKKIIKTLILLLIIFAIIGFVVWKFFDLKRREEAANTLVTYTVSRRTISEKLSATGTLQPADSYTVTAKVRGDIIEAHFEEGDEVQKDDVLYVIDSDDMDSTIRQREMSLEKAKKSLDDLKEKRTELVAKSDLTGTVTKLYVKEGDTVQKGSVVADIVDNEYMLIDIPFHASHADAMGLGTDVTLVIDGSGEKISGYVTEIASMTGTNPYGAPTKEVTIRVKNPGGISKETKATGECGTEMVSTDMGTFYYNVEEPLKAEYGGEIKNLSIREGGKVSDGQTIITFDSENLEDQIKDAEDSLETAQMNYNDTLDTLGDYEIKAPITGTVVEKGFNVGESIDVTGGNATVAIIYDLSALTFDMNIDELDIFSIEKGQEVTVTSDAFTEVFYGEITKISKVGTTSSGTTSYPVTVTITEPAALEKLLPGMNIDAEIIVNKVENVIAVPTGAVARGNTVKVIKNPEALRGQQENQSTENASGGNAFVQNSRNDDTSQEQNGNARPDGMSWNGQMPDMSLNGEVSTGITSVSQDGEVLAGMPDVIQMPAGATSGEIQSPAVYGSAPGDSEYETVKVQTGISDDDFIEIISGLEEGDIVIIDQNQASSGLGFGMMGMGGMSGGMGAGMPTGMGGMPAGGMGASRDTASGGFSRNTGTGGGMPR